MNETFLIPPTAMNEKNYFWLLLSLELLCIICLPIPGIIVLIKMKIIEPQSVQDCNLA